eukprot:GHVS01067795.1.p1 GENE.GHVS01067795.1~~GHVS01067795.1.p1  ORF type:complete len:528 (-),score=73.91 GHVS01067795.1:133-1572(-)
MADLGRAEMAIEAKTAAVEFLRVDEEDIQREGQVAENEERVSRVYSSGIEDSNKMADLLKMANVLTRAEEVKKATGKFVDFDEEYRKRWGQVADGEGTNVDKEGPQQKEQVPEMAVSAPAADEVGESSKVSYNDRMEGLHRRAQEVKKAAGKFLEVYKKNTQEEAGLLKIAEDVNKAAVNFLEFNKENRQPEGPAAEGEDEAERREQAASARADICRTRESINNDGEVEIQEINQVAADVKRAAKKFSEVREDNDLKQYSGEAADVISKLTEYMKNNRTRRNTYLNLALDFEILQKNNVLDKFINMNANEFIFEQVVKEFMRAEKMTTLNTIERGDRSYDSTDYTSRMKDPIDNLFPRLEDRLVSTTLPGHNKYTFRRLLDTFLAVSQKAVKFAHKTNEAKDKCDQTGEELRASLDKFNEHTARIEAQLVKDGTFYNSFKTLGNLVSQQVAESLRYIAEVSTSCENTAASIMEQFKTIP